MDWNRIEVWDYVIEAVASEYHKKFDTIELDDIRQSLYQWFVEHPNKLNEWEAIGKKDAKNLIFRSLRNQALVYCQRWKAKSGGYELGDLFYYESDMVEALLPPVLRGEFGVTHKLNLGRTGKSPAPAEGGNLMAMMIEIDYAFWKMSKEERRLLFLRYAESMEFGDIGKELDLGSEDAVRMRHKRVLRKLINKIGGFKPYRDNDLPDKDADSPDEIEETNNTEEE
jgi:DNA-directed RNA polymerase specialized sigma24 family protein